jgi:serine/threonine-protein kinase
VSTSGEEALEIRVMVVDDHPVWRAGIRADLEASGIVTVVGEAASGSEAIELARETTPDVVLMDLNMPTVGGVDATRRIVEEAPDVRVVILSSSGEEPDVLEAVKSGALGYLLKSSTAEEIVDAVRLAFAGQPVFSPSLAGLVLAEFRRLSVGGIPSEGGSGLSPRENETLKLVAKGYTYREIGERLSISTTTAQEHVHNVLTKLHGIAAADQDRPSVGALPTGAEIAGYRIDRIIGRGGMGVVYLAEHMRLGRKAALKVLSPELDDERLRDRFVRESQLAASLDHPNIVSIYDAGDADGILYIAMRFVEGGDLGGLIRSEGALDPGRALHIIGQVGDALDAAHGAGLVHRDVKPANILLVPGPSPDARDRVYLTDFGLTRRAASTSGLTRTGQFVGTIDYVAPEQIEGRPVDGAADVYSLGCVLYQCLTGRVPFDRDNEAAVMYAHLSDPPPPIAASRPDLPEALDGVITKALAKDPKERFSTCAALVAAARATIASETLRPENRGAEETTAKEEDPSGAGPPIGAAHGADDGTDGPATIVD